MGYLAVWSNIMKIEVLFKEYPWLINIHPNIANANSFRVKRLDTRSIELGCVSISSWEHGNDTCWFLDKDGKVIHKFPKFKNKFTGIFWRIFSTYGILVEGEMRKLAKPESVSYIVRQYGRRNCYIELIKMAKGKTLSDLLYELDVERASKDEEEYKKTLKEVRK